VITNFYIYAEDLHFSIRGQRQGYPAPALVARAMECCVTIDGLDYRTLCQLKSISEMAILNCHAHAKTSQPKEAK